MLKQRVPRAAALKAFAKALTIETVKMGEGDNLDLSFLRSSGDNGKLVSKVKIVNDK